MTPWARRHRRGRQGLAALQERAAARVRRTPAAVPVARATIRASWRWRWRCRREPPAARVTAAATFPPGGCRRGRERAARARRAVPPAAGPVAARPRPRAAAAVRARLLRRAPCRTRSAARARAGGGDRRVFGTRSPPGGARTRPDRRWRSPGRGGCAGTWSGYRPCWRSTRRSPCWPGWSPAGRVAPALVRAGGAPTDGQAALPGPAGLHRPHVGGRGRRRRASATWRGDPGAAARPA